MQRWVGGIKTTRDWRTGNESGDYREGKNTNETIDNRQPRRKNSVMNGYGEAGRENYWNYRQQLLLTERRTARWTTTGKERKQPKFSTDSCRTARWVKTQYFIVKYFRDFYKFNIPNYATSIRYRTWHFLWITKFREDHEILRPQKFGATYGSYKVGTCYSHSEYSRKLAT